MGKKINVLVVDDSIVIQKILTEIIQKDPDLTVIATASNPIEAREKIKTLPIDVMTLDIEMPKMDGITFLKNLMRLRPMPVLMISTLTQKGADITLEALALGAFDFVPKPDAKYLLEYKEHIVERIKGAASSNQNYLNKQLTQIQVNSPVLKPLVKGEYRPKSNVLVVIGASTGGTEAIKDVIIGLPANFPPVLVTQHIPPQFSASYADRVNRIAKMTVVEAKHNIKVSQGHCYVAPGSHHMVITGDVQKGYFIQLDDSEPVNRHKPSVEVMFDAVGARHKKNLFAVMLTGMGADGAKAMLRLKEAGAHCIIQDQHSSVVWGMPGECHKLGAYHEMLSLNKITQQLLSLTSLS
jgi:two-component system chemotaxis response regulator CheB